MGAAAVRDEVSGFIMGHLPLVSRAWTTKQRRGALCAWRIVAASSQQVMATGMLFHRYLALSHCQQSDKHL